MFRIPASACVLSLTLGTMPAVAADALAPPGAIAPVYRAIDLGTLPGATSSLALGINAWGDAIGSSNSDRTNQSNQSHATLFTQGTTVDLGIPPGDNFSNGYGINDAGVGIGIVGDLTSLDPVPDVGIFAGGRIGILTAPGGGTAFGQALNNQGQAAGFSYGGAVEHALRWDAGTPVDLGTLPGGAYSLGYAINNAGVVAGSSDTGTGAAHAARFDHGTVIDLDSGGTAESSNAEGINDAGLVVGQVQGATYHAFLYRAGAMVDLMPPGASYSDAAAINNQNQIVGQAYFPATGLSRAVLWQNGQIILLDPLAGYGYSVAAAINDRGWIAGYSGNSTGSMRATLWVPENRFGLPKPGM